MSSAREVIKTTLCEYSGGGQGVDDMLDAIAEQQTDAILRALDAAGKFIGDKQPSRGLLASMCLRWDHSFGMPPQMIGDTHISGYTPDEREATMASMAQVYEEISGNGFYRPEKEAEYRAMVAAAGSGE